MLLVAAEEDCRKETTVLIAARPTFIGWEAQDLW